MGKMFRARSGASTTRTGVGLALAVVLAGAVLVPAPVVAQSTGEEQGLEVLGSSDLGGKGLNGEVAVVGTTAIVGRGLLPAGGTRSGFYNPVPCPANSIEVVDLTDPTDPTVAATIELPEAVVARDVAALAVETPTFTGDLAAVALVSCNFDPGQFNERGVAYYDVTNPAAPTLLGRYQADSELIEEGDPPCGPADGQGGERCASSQHSVDLAQRPDGTVLSVSTEPFAGASGFPSGDMRIVDVTDPTNPTQLGSFPTLLDIPPGFSDNGCRPFSAGFGAALDDDGDLALLAHLDAGLFTVDVADPEAPALQGQFDDSVERSDEGNAAYVSAAEVGGRELALLASEDWNAPDTSLRIDSPASVAGDIFGCEAVFTLFDPEDTAQIYRQPGSQVPAGAGAAAEIVYLGRACPVNEPFNTLVPDPFLNVNGEPVDPTGKIALVDRAVTTRQRGTVGTPPAPSPDNQIANGGSGCSFSQKALRAQEAGAIGVIVGFGGTQLAFGPDGVPGELDIPVMAIGGAGADALRTALCPTVEPAFSGNCTSTTAVSGAMVDEPGEWGGLQVIDVTDPATPTQVGATYRPPTAEVFPPPDLGVYSVHHAVADGDLAYVAANSDGLRVLDLSADIPTEIASFVPADTEDPTNTIPDKAYVMGAAAGPERGQVVITDVHSGLYVLQVVIDPCEGVVPAPFTDIPAGNVHREAIDCLVALEIAFGTSPTTYAPEDNVRRDQMASFIARMIDEVDPDALPAPSGNPFPCTSDPSRAVGASNVHFENIQRLAAVNVVLGGPEGLPADCYGPELQVQRDQMASFINRAIGVVTGAPLSSDEDLFTDDEESVHEANINAIASEGIVLGTGGGLYAPFSSVRRDQMASFIVRTLVFLVQPSSIPVAQP